ncbi:heavy metal transporter [Streptomyces sp. NPDC046862]|uniref:heavy metal transporter n=1 Tax=Streptomyces sp. NPDC046862 TaxID=3154603 RepID=UPI0034536EB6
MSAPSHPSRRRRGRFLRRGSAFAVLLALGGYLTMQYLTGGTGAPRCEVVSGKGDGASYEFTPEQATNAATISAVGTSRGMPERAVTIALATALQESGLRNITHGDRDSLGLFQQRPSQGWGTEKQIMDPTYAAGEFYEHLTKVPGYSRLPLTVAAQRVQRSGFPQAYAKHEPDATLLAAALTGRAAATLTCEGRPAATANGGPDAVRAALVRDFGRTVLESAATEMRSDDSAATPEPTNAPESPNAPETAAASPTTPAANTVSIPVRSDSGSGTTSEDSLRRRGWELAHWAVANSSALHIERVAYADREWVAGGRAGEWRTPADSGASAGAYGDEGAGRDGLSEVRIVTGQ